MKLNKKWGFTLIEIMIVIVIISLLAVTLVPKLTWAQARSRDASRTASLMQMKAVLVTYFDDYSEFPKESHTTGSADWCLSSNSKWATTTLNDYVEWGKTSFDPQKNANVWSCNTPGSFGYIALKKNWSNQSAFILSAQTETYQKSNAIAVADLTSKDWTYDIAVLESAWKLKLEQEIGALKTADLDASKTIYTVTWG